MGNVDKSRLIEAYHRGTLKGADKAYLKQLMSEDPSFKQEVNDYKNIYNGLEALHIEQFQLNLNKMEAKYETMDTIVAVNGNSGAIRPMRRLYAIAAAVALLISCTVTYNMMMPNVFEQHFAASQSIAVHIESTRAGGKTISTAEQIKKSAFTAYQKKEYTKAIDLLKDYINTYPEKASKDYQSMLVLGVAQLAANQTEGGAKTLTHIINGTDSSYKQEAEWMWSLGQIKLEHTDAAKKVLQEMILQKEHIHQEDAVEVLGQL
jgi:TolA-binding protein